MFCGVFGAVACLVKEEERNANRQPMVAPQPVMVVQPGFVPQPGFMPQQGIPPQPGAPQPQEGSIPLNQPFIPPTTSEPPPY